MNRNTKLENFWIIILWTAIFMLILAWDQEKIVVLNLILFCYFLRYLVGDSIETTLSQRRAVLLESVMINLSTRLEILNRLVGDSKFVLNNYRIIILSILKKLLLTTTKLLWTNIYLDTCRPTIANFGSIQLALQAISEEIISKQVDQNIFVSSQILLDVNPAFTEDPLVAE